MSGQLRSWSGLAFAAFSVPALASAASGPSASSVDDEVASLSFRVVSPLVCERGNRANLSTDVLIQGGERVERGSRTRTAYATITQRNGCTGEDKQAVNIVSPDAVVTNSGVRAASIDGGFELFEYTTGEPLGFLDVNLLFRGSGGSSTETVRYGDCREGLTERTQSSAETRAATVTGTVALDGVPLFTPGLQNFASLAVSHARNATTQRARCVCTGADLTPGDPEIPSLPGSVAVTDFEYKDAGSSFFSEEPTVCDDGSVGTISTWVDLHADDNGSPPPDNEHANASLSRLNSCTGEELTGSASLEAPDYEQAALVSATLVATFELYDPASGGFTGLLDAALSLTGTGARSSCSSQLSIQDGPSEAGGSGRVLLVQTSSQETRPATLSGTITFDGQELVDAVESAQLATGHATTLRIEH